MNALKWVVVATLIGVIYRLCTSHGFAATTQLNHQALESLNGFVSLPVVHNSKVNAVVILEPPSSSSAVKQRSAQLAAALSDKAIPIAHLTHVDFAMEKPDEAHMHHIAKLMNGEPPIVLIRGRGKANPSIDTVIAEYNAPEE